MIFVDFGGRSNFMYACYLYIYMTLSDQVRLNLK